VICGGAERQQAGRWLSSTFQWGIPLAMRTNRANAKRAILLGGAMLIFALGLLTAVSHGQTADAQRAVEAGREALDGQTDFPWYDADTDSIRSVDVKESKEAAAHRNSTWQAKPAKSQTTNLRWSGWTVLWEIVRTVFWIVLILLFALLIYLLVRAFINAEALSEAAAQDAKSEPVRSEEDLIENLPFDVNRPQTDLLGEARRQYEQGAFGEAIIYLFSYQLVKLDQHGFIRLTRGKTNRQYLREIVSRPVLHETLDRTMVAFEDVFFGRHRLERQRFESCWSQLDEFHRRLDEAWG
jgi:hypothetical protein